MFFIGTTKFSLCLSIFSLLKSIFLSRRNLITRAHKKGSNLPLNVGYLDPHDQLPAFENVSYDFFITKGRDQFSASTGSAGDVTARLLSAVTFTSGTMLR